MKKILLKGLFLVLLTCIACYFIWDSNKINRNEDIDGISLEEATKYFSKINLLDYYNFSDTDKALYFYKNTDSRLTKMKTENLIAALKLDEENPVNDESVAWVSRISEDEIKNKFNDLYGDNAAYSHLDTLNLLCNTFIYEDDGYYYSYGATESVCLTNQYSLNEKIYSYRKLSDHLEIDTYVYAEKYNNENDNSKIEVFNFDNLSKVITTYDIEDEFTMSVPDSYIKQYRNKLHRYRYVFNKGSDGEYYFSKIIKIG